jgi:hypothetical protein
MTSVGILNDEVLGFSPCKGPLDHSLEFSNSYGLQHKVVEEQLHLAATIWTRQTLKEPLQCAALNIALGAGAVTSSVQNS